MKVYFFHCFFDYIVFHLINHEKSIFGLIRKSINKYTKFQSHYSKYEEGIAYESYASILEIHNFENAMIFSKTSQTLKLKLKNHIGDNIIYNFEKKQLKMRVFD